MTTIKLSSATNCSVLCGKHPTQWCCPADHLCYDYFKCQQPNNEKTNNGDQTWKFVLVTIAPLIGLTISMVSWACKLHLKDLKKQIPSQPLVNDLSTRPTSLSSSPPLKPLTEAQIFNMIKQSREIKNV